MMTADDLIQAFVVPPQACVNARVPKSVLTERGAPTAADKRAIATGIESMQWVAALRPGNTAIPAFTDAEREYLEIHVLRLHVRAQAKVDRLIELVHRAIPYPVVLITTNDGSAAIRLSLAHLRRSLSVSAGNRAEDATVLDGPVQTLTIDASDAPHVDAWRSMLSLARQPHASMLSVYQGWMDALTALEVARVTGACALPGSATQRHVRRQALDAYQRLAADETRLRAQAAKERQMARRVELTLACQRLEAERQAALAHLTATPSTMS